MQTDLRLLTHSNLQRLVDAVSQLYKPVRTQQLPGHFTSVLSQLIPGEFYGVSIVVRPKRASTQTRRDAMLDPVPPQWHSLAETFANEYTTFPLRSIRESGNLHQPLAVSDIASRQKVEGLDLYHNYYRVLSVQDDLSINFGNLDHRVCLAILRESRGFSDQDRAILAALRPHMERAYRYSKALESLRTKARRERAAATSASATAADIEDQGATPQSLRALGISEREAEVLYWVAAGKSSPVISTILGIQHDTVRTHLKSIFAKLGVENRLSAALRALEVLRSTPSAQE
jgi:DNA-binding CsgD family transcriptional regulator